MADAAVEALREGSRRLSELVWIPAGFMLGASVAALAADRVGSEALLLGQPALRPSEYFETMARRARRAAALTRSGEETVFGYALSRALLSSAAPADTQVEAALADFEGTGAVVRYSSPIGTDEVPKRFDRVEVDGTWRFAARDDSRLGKAAGGWLTDYMRKRE
jgi:hypothetical protein